MQRATKIEGDFSLQKQIKTQHFMSCVKVTRKGRKISKIRSQQKAFDAFNALME